MGQAIENVQDDNIISGVKGDLVTVIAQMPIPIVITEPNGDIIYCNAEFIEQFGYTLKDIKTAQQWWETAYPDTEYRKRVRKSWEKAIAEATEKGTKIKHQEWDLTIKDRTVRRVEFSMMPLENISVIAMIDITEREIAKGEIQKKANDLAVLMKVSEKFTSTLDLDILFQSSTDGIVELTDLDSSAIYLLRNEYLYLAATTPPLPSGFPEHLRQAPLSEHPHIKESLTGDVVFIKDTQKIDLTPAEREISETRNLRSNLYFPIKFRERIAGTLIVASCDEPRIISVSEIDLCKTLSHHAALAIENAQNHQQVKDYANNLEEQVEKRTAELQAEMNSKTELFDLMVGREVRMAELKKVIKKLRKQLCDADLEPIADDPLNEPFHHKK